MGLILSVILVLLLVGASLSWPQSRNWGYYLGSGLGTVVVIVLILMLVGWL